MVGLPKKDNNEKPLFDYEKLLYDSLLNETFKAHSYLLSQELTFSTDIGTHNLRARVNLVPLLGPLSYICE
jgi:hypothetical protein